MTTLYETLHPDPNERYYEQDNWDSYTNKERMGISVDTQSKNLHDATDDDIRSWLSDDIIPSKQYDVARHVMLQGVSPDVADKIAKIPLYTANEANSAYAGYYLPGNKQLIQLDKKRQDATSQLLTSLHEFGHAIDYNTDRSPTFAKLHSFLSSDDNIYNKHRWLYRLANFRDEVAANKNAKNTLKAVLKDDPELLKKVIGVYNNAQVYNINATGYGVLPSLLQPTLGVAAGIGFGRLGHKLGTNLADWAANKYKFDKANWKYKALKWGTALGLGAAGAYGTYKLSSPLVNIAEKYFNDPTHTTDSNNYGYAKFIPYSFKQRNNDFYSPLSMVGEGVRKGIEEHAKRTGLDTSQAWYNNPIFNK